MLRSILYVFVLGALINVAKCDFGCFAKRMEALEKNLDLFSGETKEEFCRSGQKEFVDSLQHAIDECSVPVSTNSMKVLIQELCEPGSELYQTLDQSGNCLLLNSPNNAACQLNRMDSSLPAKEGCLKLKRDILACSAKAIGEPCGEKAVKALQRIYKTTAALTKGLCDEIVSSSSYSLASVAKYLHWVAIAVAVLSIIVLIMKKLNKKNASNQFRWEKV